MHYLEKNSHYLIFTYDISSLRQLNLSSRQTDLILNNSFCKFAAEMYFC